MGPTRYVLIMILKWLCPRPPPKGSALDPDGCAASDPVPMALLEKLATLMPIKRSRPTFSAVAYGSTYGSRIP